MTANKIKKGDFVICIKIPKSKPGFKINNLYEIHELYSDGYILLKMSNIMYSGFELLEPKSSRYFFDYFITLQQYRKLKLKKINESI